ncbi:MAG: SDR family oxidoreductase [Nitrospiraceae bacterium]
MKQRVFQVPRSASSESPCLWVTGGSRGIGRAVAQRFGAAGWRVAVQYVRREQEALGTAKLVEAAGGEAIIVQADVRDAGQVGKAARTIEDRWHRLDALVCGAGVADDGLIVRTSLDRWNHVIETNLTGVFHCLREAARLMESHGGNIVVLGSFVGFHGAAGQAAYAASKAGLLALIRSAAWEWGPNNIRVNVALPGWQKTDLAADALPGGSWLADHMLGRTADLEEVTRSIYHLATVKDTSGQVWNFDSRSL